MARNDERYKENARTRSPEHCCRFESHGPLVTEEELVSSNTTSSTKLQIDTKKLYKPIVIAHTTHMQIMFEPFSDWLFRLDT